jgi:hypothetical protein
MRHVLLAGAAVAGVASLAVVQVQVRAQGLAQSPATKPPLIAQMSCSVCESQYNCAIVTDSNKRLECERQYQACWSSCKK